MRYFVFEDGEPREVDVHAFGEWYGREAWQALRLCSYVVDGDTGRTVEVSTVYRGIDSRPFEHYEGPPLLWETMVFGGGCDGHQARYATRAEAAAGHAEVIRHVTTRPEDRRLLD